MTILNFVKGVGHNFLKPETRPYMIIYNSNCLEVCIYNLCTKKTKTSILHILANLKRKFSLSRNFAYGTPAIYYGLHSYKSPQVFRETSQTVATSRNAFAFAIEASIFILFLIIRVCLQFFNVIFCEVCNYFGVKVIISLPVILSF